MLICGISFTFLNEQQSNLRNGRDGWWRSLRSTSLRQDWFLNHWALTGFLSPSNSYVQALTLNVVALGDGAFGGVTSLPEVMRVGPSGWLVPSPVGETPELSHMAEHSENAKARERALNRNWPADLRLPASRIVRNEFLLLKPSSLWYFLMAACAD